MTMVENAGRRGRVAGLVALLAVCSLAAPSIRAQEHEEAHDAPGEHGEGAERFAGHHVHADHKNGLALFLGGTMGESTGLGTAGRVQLGEARFFLAGLS